MFVQCTFFSIYSQYFPFLFKAYHLQCLDEIPVKNLLRHIPIKTLKELKAAWQFQQKLVYNFKLASHTPLNKKGKNRVRARSQD